MNGFAEPPEPASISVHSAVSSTITAPITPARDHCRRPRTIDSATFDSSIRPSSTPITASCSVMPNHHCMSGSATI